LSYTTFRYSNLRLSSPRLASHGSLTVSVDVKNAGSRTGDEVVQLYVQHMRSKVERPRKELRGFERVTLRPDETRTVEMKLKGESLAWWNEKAGRFEVETEPVRILVGSSSADVRLQKTVNVK
jgi:beta-glucosidase